jgi:Protein of unknown function (DUF2796)
MPFWRCPDRLGGGAKAHSDRASRSVGSRTQENPYMRKWLLLFIGMALAAHADAQDAGHRELGAHEHGRGTLNIAVEGKRLSMELEVPGADIVGFEHEPKTPRQKAAVAAAKKQLAAPQSLFQLPQSAGCVLDSVQVAVESEDHDHDAKQQEPKKAEGSGTKAGDHDDHGHSQFHVQYVHTCKEPTRITTIEFGYFKVFVGAQKLDINLIGAKGQARFEVTRANPRIDLAGQM